MTISCFEVSVTADWILCRPMLAQPPATLFYPSSQFVFCGTYISTIHQQAEGHALMKLLQVQAP